MTRKAAATVRFPGARIAPASSTWACDHIRSENSGANGFSRCSILVGRVCIVASLGRLATSIPYLSRLPERLKSSEYNLHDDTLSCLGLTL